MEPSFKKRKAFKAALLPMSRLNFRLLMNLFLPKIANLFLITC